MRSLTWTGICVPICVCSLYVFPSESHGMRRMVCHACATIQLSHINRYVHHFSTTTSGNIRGHKVTLNTVVITVRLHCLNLLLFHIVRCVSIIVSFARMASSIWYYFAVAGGHQRWDITPLLFAPMLDCSHWVFFFFMQNGRNDFCNGMMNGDACWPLVQFNGYPAPWRLTISYFFRWSVLTVLVRYRVCDTRLSVLIA